MRATIIIILMRDNSIQYTTHTHRIHNMLSSYGINNNNAGSILMTPLRIKRIVDFVPELYLSFNRCLYSNETRDDLMKFLKKINTLMV